MEKSLPGQQISTRKAHKPLRTSSFSQTFHNHRITKHFERSRRLTAFRALDVLRAKRIISFFNLHNPQIDEVRKSDRMLQYVKHGPYEVLLVEWQS